MEHPSLDVVIIGRNEGEHLANVYDSVRNATRVFNDHFKAIPKTVYIDSRSTDNSIEVAQEYGITYEIIKGTISPAIARQKGLEITNSEYIFFLDGDTEVFESWLVDGTRYLLENKSIAGVGGILEFNMYKDGKLVWTNNNYRNTRKDGEQVYDGVGGTFLYRRSDIISCGGFNSKFEVGEEFELMLRLVNNNKRIVRILKQMAVHHDHKSWKQGFMKRYLFTKNIFVSGAIIKNSPKSYKTIEVILRRYWLTILHLPLVIAMIATWLIGFYEICIIILLLLVFLHLLTKNFNLERTLYSLISMNFYSLGIFVGLFKSNAASG